VALLVTAEPIRVGIVLSAAQFSHHLTAIVVVLIQDHVDFGRLTVNGRFVPGSLRHERRFFTAGRSVARDALLQLKRVVLRWGDSRPFV
jgi:hypothetical protein